MGAIDFSDLFKKSEQVVSRRLEPVKTAIEERENRKQRLVDATLDKVAPGLAGALKDYIEAQTPARFREAKVCSFLKYTIGIYGGTNVYIGSNIEVVVNNSTRYAVIFVCDPVAKTKERLSIRVIGCDSDNPAVGSPMKELAVFNDASPTARVERAFSWIAGKSIEMRTPELKAALEGRHFFPENS